MTLTMQDVMADPMFERTAPTVEAGEAGMSGTVRWAYTNERYDIASFLSGGELVIIEGSALLSHMDDNEIIRYVDTLVDAGVAGLAIELVEGVRTVPPAMIAHANTRALPVIGMHRRMPFVDLCQSINTAIVKDQLLVQVRTDALATTMRTRLATARSAQDVAKTLNDIFGESVAIFDSDGLVVAHSGPTIRPADAGRPAERTLVLDVRKNGGPLASIEITQRNRLADGQIAEQVSEVIRQVLPAFIQTQPRNAMLAHVLRGPANERHATEQEAGDAAAMLQAIGLDSTNQLVPFVIGMDSVSSSIDAVSRCLSGDGTATISGGDGGDENGVDHVGGRIGEAPAQGAEEGNIVADEGIVVDVLEGNLLFGLYAASLGSIDRGNSGSSASAGKQSDSIAGTRLERRLADESALPGIWCIYGRAVSSVGMLLDECGLLQFAAREMPPAAGTVANLLDAAPKRLLGIERTRDAAGTLQSLMLGDALLGHDSLLRTLEACFDTGGNISKACGLLGIHRQTMYNRLEKIGDMTGVSKDDCMAWPLLLCAAKLAAVGRTSSGRPTSEQSATR
ncbi:PucR family transcriptional regulator [Bifidobacterium boum]|uniref:PucR family transcriptional regulator n=1 Tax=Bifidobacterium boum TaxID=78343 RepID=UPI001F2DFF07|nr:PucR family transcriptional regulator ligand-binding domain-containing protein [Bifidobacterium boum]MCF2562089.1 PucR family transcriptional regulator [Bifidobacterium boum]